MRTTKKLLSLLMALLLAIGNMTFSAHVTSHAASDSAFCSVCIHSGGPDSAIAHEPGTYFVRLEAFTFTQIYTPMHFLPAILHVHQSRAPPRLA